MGLCFKCGEKYYPGHQCKVKVNMLLGQTELEEEGEGETVGIFAGQSARLAFNSRQV